MFDVTHRIFKLRLLNGKWSTLPQLTESKLKELIAKDDYSDFYMSASLFLNPQDVGKENVTPILIDSQLIIDWDGTDEIGIFRLLNFMKTRYMVDRDYILLTSPNHYQINFGSLKKLGFGYNQDLKKRLEEVTLFKKTIMEDIKVNGFNIDILPHWAHVFRVPNSKRADGFVTHFHSVEVGTKHLKIQANSKVELSDCGVGNELTPKETNPPVYMKYNTRLAISRYLKSHLLFLNYKSLKFEQVVKDIEMLDDKYNIGGGLLRVAEDGIQFVGLTPHNKRRVEKIMKASGASNVKNALKFGCTLLQNDFKVSGDKIVGVEPVIISKFNIDKIVVSELTSFDVEWEKRL